MANAISRLLRWAGVLLCWIWIAIAPPALAQNAVTYQSQPFTQGEVKQESQSSFQASSGTQTTQQLQKQQPQKQEQWALQQSSAPASQRTYEQPPNPYNRQAIETFDQSVYGADR